MSRCIILLGNTMLTQFEHEVELSLIEQAVPGCILRSISFFCPRCVEIWARILIVGFEFGYPLRQFCRKHGCGSLIHPFAYSYLDSANEDFWNYELQLLAEDPALWSDALDISGVICPT